MRHIFMLITLLLSVSVINAQETTIAEILSEHPELSQFADILELAEPSLLERLNDPEADLTLFVPTNAAFEQFAADLEQPDSWQAFVVNHDSFSALLEDNEVLSQIASYHLIDEPIVWDDLLLEIKETGYVHYVTLNGSFLTISALVSNTGEVVVGEGVYILESNPAYIDQTALEIEASNGVIYLLDYPLFPELRTIGQMLADDASFGETEGEFVRLTELINAADPSIMEMLNDPEANLTLFAPYDDAFVELADFDALLADSEAATAFLQHYIIPERVFSFQLEAGQELESLSGDLLLVPDEATFFGEFFVNDTFVFIPNRIARNGVIHEIETLLD